MHQHGALAHLLVEAQMCRQAASTDSMFAADEPPLLLLAN